MKKSYECEKVSDPTSAPESCGSRARKGRRRSVLTGGTLRAGIPAVRKDTNSGEGRKLQGGGAEGPIWCTILREGVPSPARQRTPCRTQDTFFFFPPPPPPPPPREKGRDPKAARAAVPWGRHRERSKGNITPMRTDLGEKSTDRSYLRSPRNKAGQKNRFRGGGRWREGLAKGKNCTAKNRSRTNRVGRRHADKWRLGAVRQSSRKGY